MASCEFLNHKDCFLIKRQCEKENEFSECKYWKRQNPSDKLEYIKRFKKALQEALKKRDFFEEYRRLMEDASPDFSKSIYYNIEQILESIKPYEIEMKGKKELEKKDLEGNILHNIVKKVKHIKKIKILQQFENKNQILIEEDGNKVVVKIKEALDTFFDKLKHKDNKGAYLNSKVEDTINLHK